MREFVFFTVIGALCSLIFWAAKVEDAKHTAERGHILSRCEQVGGVPMRTLFGEVVCVRNEVVIRVSG
ncbi:hypothetical protein [Phaeobacter phage MD18]|nr:hypothetical protein [Phaeobacter phage MD18]